MFSFKWPYNCKQYSHIRKIAFCMSAHEWIFVRSASVSRSWAQKADISQLLALWTREHKQPLRIPYSEQVPLILNKTNKTMNNAELVNLPHTQTNILFPPVAAKFCTDTGRYPLWPRTGLWYVAQDIQAKHYSSELSIYCCNLFGIKLLKVKTDGGAASERPNLSHLTFATVQALTSFYINNCWNCSQI